MSQTDSEAAPSRAERVGGRQERGTVRHGEETSRRSGSVLTTGPGFKVSAHVRTSCPTQTPPEPTDPWYGSRTDHMFPAEQGPKRHQLIVFFAPTRIHQTTRRLDRGLQFLSWTLGCLGQNS